MNADPRANSLSWSPSPQLAKLPRFAFPETPQESCPDKPPRTPLNFETAVSLALSFSAALTAAFSLCVAMRAHLYGLYMLCTLLQ